MSTRKSCKESQFRSLFKTISWRVIASTTTFLLVLLFTRKVTLSLGIGAAEVISKMLFYYLHERVWATVSYGQVEG